MQWHDVTRKIFGGAGKILGEQWPPLVPPSSAPVGNSLPNIIIMLRTFLTTAVSVATCKRKFSKLKLIKNCLRPSMSTLRLRNLATLSIEQQLSLRVVFFRLCFSLFTLTISQKHPLFMLLYLLMILISICQIPLLLFFRQLLTLNYVKLTNG